MCRPLVVVPSLAILSDLSGPVDVKARWMCQPWGMCDPGNMTGEPIVVAILMLVALGVWLWRRRGGVASRESETRLRRICLGDEGQVERLINGEIARAPGISRAEAASRAVDRYRRDNR
jgi:hypothetical protein